MQSTERWLPVPGWEGMYEVSDFGRVRTLGREVVEKNGKSRYTKPRIMRGGPNVYGYPQVALTRTQGDRRVSVVHQLVLEAFVGPRPDGMVACHYDDDRTNNHLSNLRWGTVSENADDAVRNGLHFWSRRTHCAKGHEYTPENIYVLPGERYRICRECDRAKRRRYERRSRGTA